MFGEKCNTLLNVLEATGYSERISSNKYILNNFKGERHELSYTFKLKPDISFDDNSKQMDFITGSIIAAMLSDYDNGTQYTITFSSNELQYKCKLPLLRKRQTIENDILFQINMYCFTSLREYRDTFKLKIKIFVEY